MDDSIKLFMEIAAFIIALIGQSWVIVRYLLDRIDKERQERHEDATEMKAQINSFRNDHVRRDDFLLHMENMHKQVDNLVNMLNNLTAKVDTRLDTIMSMLAGKEPKK